MDEQVASTQEWLNATYTGVAGWVELDEDGITGWATIYGLRRGLQHELGISPVASGFGPITAAQFVSQIGVIDDDSVSENILLLLSGSLWCKGYPGVWPGAQTSFATMSPSIASVRADLGLGSGDPFVDVKLMASLMSMDAYLRVSTGVADIREVQQWLNRMYSARRDFALVPCDGVYSRQVQTALLFGLQYELGMVDGTANGSFGPATRTGLRTNAQVGPGDVDGAHRFVHLFQASLRFNDHDVPFSGSFNDATAETTREFQGFMELPITGRGDYSTWCSLLVSSGDTSIATAGFDTKTQLSAAEASSAVAAGYDVVGRYIVGATKYITATEMDGLRAAGLTLFPIHQRSNNSPGVMTEANGRLHAIEAMERCRVLGIPDGSTVYFTVDFDAMAETIDGPVVDYFRGVQHALNSSVRFTYRAGVYGTRNVCTKIIEAGYAHDAWVAGMSTGYSGNMGFRMPQEWRYNQILETTVGLASRTVAIDKDVVSESSNAVDLSQVITPPVERDGSTTATGFDAFFEWLVRGEVACERALSDQSTFIYPLEQFAPLVDDYILHWLQLPKYSDGFWWFYTPILDVSASHTFARMAAEEALRGMVPPAPGGLEDVAAFLEGLSTRDIQHFGATLQGYLTYGVPTTHDTYNLGDLGGWPLDLLQIWGRYVLAETQSPGLDLRSYLTDRIGTLDEGSGVDSPPRFGWSDLVADADAYLVARRMRDDSLRMSEALRVVLGVPSGERVYQFYISRFGGSAPDLQAAFLEVVDGIELAVFDDVGITKGMLMRAAEADRLPNQEEASICAAVLAAAFAVAAG